MVGETVVTADQLKAQGQVCREIEVKRQPGL